MKKIQVSILAIIVSITMTAATCSKASLLSNATDVLSSLQAAQPLINQLVPSASPKIAQAVSIATKLKDAIAANDSKSAAALLIGLIPTFSSIVNEDINALTAAQKTTILAALALADIGLHYLVNHLQTSMPTAAGPKSPVTIFSGEEVWGLKYKTKK